MAEHRRPVPYPPGEALLAAYRLRGPVIDVGAGGHGYVLLLGAEANKFVFANAHPFSWWETFQNLAVADGPTALIVSDGEAHRRRRRLVQPALHHRQIEHYLQTMADSADAVIASWRPSQRLDIYQAMRSAIRHAIIASLFGSRLAADAQFFGQQL
ncbi:MAG: cytochrome P450, partial [Acetobacteraceae bacterium]|nr:cytochrome P450 [Acetobacteraceae bacterium]